MMVTKQQDNKKGPEKSVLSAAVDKVLDFPPVKLTLKVFKALGDDTFFNWLGHGSTELANMVLHGHAAPVYSHASSPLAQTNDLANSVQPIQAVAHEPAKNQEVAPGTAKVIGKYMPDRNEAEKSQEQTMVTSHGVAPSASPGIVEQHMQDVRAMPDMQMPDQEISR